MARTFVAASSQKLVVGSTPVTAIPLTLACWWKPVSSAATANAILSINNAGNSEFRIGQNSSGATTAIADQASSLGTATSSATLSSGVWAHACGVFTSATSRAAFLNGAGKGTNATNLTPAGLNAIDVAHSTDAASFANGDIAECAIWNVALADADVATLAIGVAAYFVRPDALVFYAPLLAGFSPEIDIVGGRTLTLTNAPTVIGGPGIVYKQKVNV